MKKINFILICIIILSVFCNSYSVFAEENKITIDFFYSSSCSHCEIVKGILDRYQNENTDFNTNTKINLYEIHEESNKNLIQNYYNAYNIPIEEQGKVPIVFIGNKYILGVNSFEANLLVYYNTYVENKELYQSDLTDIQEKIENTSVTEEETDKKENGFMPITIISVFSIILLFSVGLLGKNKKE